jgi:peptidoglycan/xylan/chitin deacetylase (PgdA/CDA1 family)
MYHHVANVLPTTNLLDRSLTVTPTFFGAQLDYLKKRGYQTITFNQIMDALYYGGPLPKKPIILTFDDGYDDAYNYAYPILKAHGFSGMFYIITGKVGWRGQASWDQLKQMLANGMQIGSHTIHHVDMGDTYLSSPALAQQEVQIAQATLQSNLGIPIQHFCYPNGGPFKGHNLVLQQKVVALLAKSGYISATTDPGPTGFIQSSLTPLAMLRIRVDGRETIPQFTGSLPAV